MKLSTAAATAPRDLLPQEIESILVLFPTLIVVATVLLVLRLYGKYRCKRPFGHDDYLLGSSYFLYLASVITVLIPLASRDVVTDGVAAKYVTAVHIMAVGSALNIVSLVLAKLAIVATLLRIVKKAHSQWENRFLLSVGVLTVGFVLTAGFGFCYGTWRSTLDDDCVQRTGFWSYGIFSAVWSSLTDFVLAIFSWFTIWRLNLRPVEKIGICVVLSLGVVAGSIAAAKVSVLADFCPGIDLANPTTGTSEYWTAKQSIMLLVYSFAEGAIMIIGAATPNVRLLVRDLVRRRRAASVPSASRRASTIPSLPSSGIQMRPPPTSAITTSCIGGASPTLPKIESTGGILATYGISRDVEGGHGVVGEAKL